MLIGARLNWLLSHGKGKSWGDAPKKFIQIDIEPKEMDSNVEIVAPVVGDIGSCVEAIVKEMGGSGGAAASDWVASVTKKRDENSRQDGAAADEQQLADGLSRRARRAAHDHQGAAERDPGQRGRQHLDLARGIIDMYQPRKRIDVGTWGIMGIGMGYSIAAAIETGTRCSPSRATARSASPGMEIETICRYNLPVCVVVFNNDGIYRGTDTDGGRRSGDDVFVKGARYDKMIEAFGGVGVTRRAPTSSGAP
jgi:oxalyl-CoA decarboxylase